MVEIKQAVIFAGGLGLRLRPFTETAPKPLFKINNKPFLEYLITQLKEWEIEEIIILLGYLPNKIIDYFGDGSSFGINIKYVTTPVEYDTQKRLKAAEKILNQEFLMLYCDNICPIDFKKLKLDFEKKKIKNTNYSI